MKSLNLNKFIQEIPDIDPIQCRGQVVRVVGSLIEGLGPAVCIGDLCQISIHNGSRHVGHESILAEVVGFREEKILLMPLGDLRGIGPDCGLKLSKESAVIKTSNSLLGRVIDEFGNPLDDKGPIYSEEVRSIHQISPEPLKRSRIKQPLSTGVRAIDTLITCGKGQRVGLFAGSGVGKSVLMGMISRNTSAQVNVIGLIGERGREIREFIEDNLGESGMKHSVVVAVPSDRPPMSRVYAALATTTIAEYFRDQGKDVLLMLDSATRIAMALREIGLAAGEPPTAKGYTPSVFGFLPKLLERAGMVKNGSITGFYTVLMEGDDIDDPVVDTMRSILDGHIVLSRKLAARSHYPAIDVLGSISRLMVDVTTPQHQKSANQLREVLSIYNEAEDLINVGAYVKGSQPKIDQAIGKIEKVNRFLNQGINENVRLDQSIKSLSELFPN